MERNIQALKDISNHNGKMEAVLKAVDIIETSETPREAQLCLLEWISEQEKKWETS